MTLDVSQSMIERALDLAMQWQRLANQMLLPEEKERQEKMRRLLAHPMDKAILVKLFDQSFRSRNPARVADQMHYLLESRGIPAFFSGSEKVMLALFRDLGRYLPSLVIPKIIDRMQESSRRMIIAGEPQALHAYLQKRKAEGLQVNLNRLGEEVLGEDEALRRLESYLHDLRNPLVEHMSVKISTIFSQIDSLAFDHCVAVLTQRLTRLFEQARRHPFTRADGSTADKMVTLDMEAYHDLALTVTAFKRALDQPELLACPAGIALQAYLPEAYDYQQELTEWALERMSRGGSPIKIRLVKGANMEMELIEAALNDWPLAPFDNKPDVDANYKRMVLFGVQPAHIQAVRLGVASHNLFELAFAHEAARANGVAHLVVFEMLEGMADHVCRALHAQGLPLLLYAPVAGEKEFLNAIAYLIRRMDENTGPDNFLRHAPYLAPDTEIWRHLQERFSVSCNRADLPRGSHRRQNRMTEVFAETMEAEPDPVFHNEPNTDWSLAPNREWAQQIGARWRKNASAAPLQIPLVVAGQNVSEGRALRDIIDPNQLPEQVVVARCALAGPQDIDQAVAASRADPDGWRRLSVDRRHATLRAVARALRRARAELIGAAAANTGKIFTEADIEVSEAVDFAEYYPLSVRAFDQRAHLQMQGKGVGVVVSPWNFPIAIPCGGLLAALAAGNTVIFKPSSEALLVGWLLCDVFWQAGVSRNTLQFVPCSGSSEGRRLIVHADVDFVILTGGTETAMHMLRQRPDLFLAAETGGKNCTIVTALADREQAVKNVITSAFGNSGQKCSATSLLILEKEVYQDPHFKEVLVDAARSLIVGSAWDLKTRMGPLVHPPGDALQRGLTCLEAGEHWALQPGQVGDNPNLWTPGIKWGVQPGSFTHMTELFGPVLGVMRADDLEEALALANYTGYGLTAAIESLDPREIAQWKQSMRAGNLYVNRTTTGAVTLRQPFGGMGKSAVGPAIKVGGPSYVAQFMDFQESGPPPAGIIRSEHPLLALAQRWQRKCRWGGMGPLQADVQQSIRAIESYLQHAWEFTQPQDYFHLRGQDNHLRHLPVGRLAVCLHPQDSLFEVIARLAAGLISGCRVTLIRPPDLANDVTRFLDGEEGRLLLQDVQVELPGEAEPEAWIHAADRLRYAAPARVPAAVFAAAAQAGVYIARAPVLTDGRVELLHYYLGQSICDNYHRYGNLGERAAARAGF